MAVPGQLAGEVKFIVDVQNTLQELVELGVLGSDVELVEVVLDAKLQISFFIVPKEFISNAEQGGETEVTL